MSLSGKKICKRGDIVSYAGIKFFCQPNGHTCYLYKDREDIGSPRMAVYIVSRESIRFPPAPGSKAPDKNRHRPMGPSSDQYEYEMGLLNMRLEMMRLASEEEFPNDSLDSDENST